MRIKLFIDKMAAHSVEMFKKIPYNKFPFSKNTDDSGELLPESTSTTTTTTTRYVDDIVRKQQLTNAVATTSQGPTTESSGPYDVLINIETEQPAPYNADAVGDYTIDADNTIDDDFDYDDDDTTRRINPENGEEEYYEPPGAEDMDDAEMTEEERANMTEVYFKQYTPMKLPLPLDYPTYLRKPVDLPFQQTKTSRYRISSNTDKMKLRGQLTWTERKAEKQRKLQIRKERELKEQQEKLKQEDQLKRKSEAAGKSGKNGIIRRPTYNKTDYLRSKYIRKEIIMTDSFIDHYSRYQKPPFVTAARAVKKCPSSMPRVRKSKSSAISTTAAVGTEESMYEDESELEE